MSIPLYTCRESADIISEPLSLARRAANFVLPEAVGPKITIKLKVIRLCLAPALRKT